tara:strand:+ start:495 stop:3062 length:2568 start_codon:yes stop_codon:yes gene_type:complete
MARLPRLRSAGVQAAIPRSVDFAGLRGEAAVGQTISQTFDQMSNFLYKTAQKEAVRSGIERVRTEGAQPILEAMKAQGGPRGLEEETAYEAANKIAIAEIQTEAELEIAKILTDGQNNKTPFSSIQSQLKSVSDGFPAALSDIDPVSAAMLRTNLQGKTEKAGLRYSEFWSKETLRTLKERQNIAAANKAETIIGNASVAGFDPKELEKDITEAATELKDLGVRPNDLTTWSENVREEALKNNILFDFYQKDLSEQEEFINDIKSGKTTLPGMDFETSIRFINGLLSPEYNRNKRAVEAQSTFIINRVEDLEDVLENGGQIDQEELANLLSDSSNVINYDEGASSTAARGLQDTSNFFGELRTKSLAELEAYVTNLETNGFDGTLDTPEEVTRVKQAQNFLTNMRTQVNDNPMGYAAKVGLIKRNEIITVDEDSRLQIDQGALTERLKQATVVAREYGLANPPVFFKDEINQLGLALEKAEGAVKLDILGMLSTIGESNGEVLTQLSEYNKSDALIGGLVTMGSTRAATLAVNGMDRLKNDLTPPGFTSTNTDPVFLDVVGKHMFNAPIQQSAIKDVAKAIYTELAAQQGLGNWKDNTDEAVALYEQALQLASGQRKVMTDTGEVIYGGMQPVREKMTFIPPNMTAADMEKVIANLNPASIEAITGQKIDPAYPEKIKEEETYKLIFAGGNQYYISNVEDVDRFGDDVPVLDVDESTILFNPMDFLQPMPEIPGPEVKSEVVGTINLSDAFSDPVDKPDLTTAQDPTVERGQQPKQRFAFEAALGANTKQTKKLRKELNEGLQSGKLNEASTVRYLESLPEPGDDNFDADLYTKYADFIIDGGSLTYAQWLKTQQ